jgi:hypothetical protein
MHAPPVLRRYAMLAGVRLESRRTSGYLKVKVRAALWALTAILLAGARLASATALELRVGDPSLHGENGFPFGTLPASYGYSNTRYQQVYSSALFPQPFSISEIVFFVSSNGGAALLPATMEIYLSTTAVGVNEIDGRAFDDNLGEQTRYFATIGGDTLPGSELAIFGQPFRYDPAMGNLLVDVRVHDAPFGYTGPFFAAFTPADRAAGGPALVSRWHDFGTGFDDIGLATAFRGRIAEPGTLLLMVAGLIAAAFVVRTTTASATGRG